MKSLSFQTTFSENQADNERLEKFEAIPVGGVDRIKRTRAKAMEDTDNRLMTQSNAKQTRTKKTTIVDKTAVTTTTETTTTTAQAENK